MQDSLNDAIKAAQQALRVPPDAAAAPATILPPITTDSAGLPLRPSLLDEAGWTVPAEPSEAAEVVAFLLPLIEADASEGRAVALTGMFAARGFSRAELYHVCNELPWLPKARHTFGNQGLGLGDVQALVDEVRTLRRALSANSLTPAQVDRIALLDPALAGGFGVRGVDESGGTRYALKAERRAARLGLPVPPRRELLLAHNPQDPAARVPLGLRARHDVDEAAPDAPTLPTPTATIHRLPPPTP